MQFRPLLTGACGSPLVATTRPSRVPTRMPQPVPQKRQTPLSHETPASAAAACARATSESGMPAVAAVTAAIPCFTKSRRLRLVMGNLPGFEVGWCRCAPRVSQRTPVANRRAARAPQRDRPRSPKNRRVVIDEAGGGDVRKRLDALQAFDLGIDGRRRLDHDDATGFGVRLVHFDAVERRQHRNALVEMLGARHDQNAGEIHADPLCLPARLPVRGRKAQPLDCRMTTDLRARSWLGPCLPPEARERRELRSIVCAATRGV